jgi:hypothetical protein
VEYVTECTTGALASRRPSGALSEPFTSLEIFPMQSSLETALADLAGRLEVVAKTAKAASAALKKATASAKVGQLRDLARSLAEGRSAAMRFAQEMEAADRSWTFELDPYMSGGGYLSELVEEAGRAGLSLFERDGRIYCFPMLVTLAPRDAAVLVNRKAERKVRPRELVRLLLARQKAPQKMNEQRLLDTLFEAYSLVGPKIRRDWTPELPGSGPVVPLLRIHKALTMLPGTERDYPPYEFARDILLLDRKPELRTRDGRRFALPAATATKGGPRLAVVDQNGAEKVYAGIRFDME